MVRTKLNSSEVLGPGDKFSRGKTEWFELGPDAEDAGRPQDHRQGLRWYVFYTSIHAEEAVQRLIRELGYQTFVPFEKRSTRLLRRKSPFYLSPLFPRYGFVRFNIAYDDWGQILHAKGVFDLLRQQAQPVAVDDHAINGLQLAEKIGLFDRTKPPKVGMKVQITSGPLTDFIGKVVRVRARDRVRVLLSLLGGAREVVIPVSSLQEI